MQDYPTQTLTMSVDVPKTAAGLGAIVSLADQLDAACSDLWSAWSAFQFGDEGPTAEESPRQPPADRIERVTSQASATIGRLRNLAEQIRSRV